MPESVARRIRVAAMAPAGVCLAAFLWGCAGARPAQVSPQEIPQLEARLAEEPDNGELILRYAAALYASGRCDTASAVAARGAALRPTDALGPLVIGQCAEQAEEYDQALAVYRRFLADHRDGPGVPAIRAREAFALRARATQRAQTALAREADLAGRSADLETVAVLPLEIAGDSAFQPLSRGLAEMITSDLALLQRFRMVERLQVGALLEEMQLTQAGLVDTMTAARVGRLLQAGRMVQGLAAIPPEGNVRLEAAIVRTDGVVTTPAVGEGRLPELLRLEKDLVVEIAAHLGHSLSQAERRLILENGTQSLTAFLAYSRGLVAENLGDYDAAVVHFSQAVQADPGFNAARTRYQAAAGAQEARQASASHVTQLATMDVLAPDLVPDPVGDAMLVSVGDVAATQAEKTQVSSSAQQATRQSTTTTAAQPPPTLTQAGLTATIRIIFSLP
jgi:tetratricopeptide (TPR) repeat protein